MQDLIHVALMVAFTVIAWAFVVAYDKLIGSDDAALRVASCDDAAPSRPARRGTA